MPRPIQAAIHLSALSHNLEIVRQRAPRSSVMAVIKAGGYGHGLLRAAHALEAAQAFAVVDLDDAVALREAGYHQRILLLEGFFAPADLPPIVRYGLTPVIHQREQVAMLNALPQGAKLDIFLKLNSGMNRLGFSPAEYPAVLQGLQRHAGTGQIVLMTHFADADNARGVAWQMQRFNEAAGGSMLPRSLANSAALLRYPETHADWVRPGIMLYGASPFAEQGAAEFGLLPAMTLRSRIVAVQELRAGDRIGYGGTFAADKTMRVGIVACGYADGYPRHAPTGTPILVDGKLTRTLGRVSMDMLYADLSALPQAGVGSAVTLWGEGLPAEEVARAADTVSYELLCALAPRVPVREE